MDQNLIDDDFSGKEVNEDNLLRNTNNDGENSNKYNQCDYTSSVESSLRRHLKTHKGEKSNKCNQAEDFRRYLKTHSEEMSNKCNQCDYASSQAGNLWRHLKTHS